MHQNAEITFRLGETNSVLNVLLSMQPKEGGQKDGETRESQVDKKARAMLEKTPEDYALKTTVKRILLAMDPSNDPNCKDKKPRPPLNVFLEQEL